MRIAYLILAHNNPAHLERLVGQLSAPGSAFFVHIDAKANLELFTRLKSKATFCKRRVNCGWGDISLVDATLELMKSAASEPSGFDYYVLLSGACYPLQTPEYISEFLSRRDGVEYIEVFDLPNAEYNKPIERVTRFWIRKGKPLARLRWPLQRLLHVILPKRDYKKALGDGALVTGSQWWCLTGEAVKYVLEVTTRQPAIYRFCKFVDCPDEFYFQFVLWNSRFRSKISHSLTFTAWAPGKTGPELIDTSYLSQFSGSVIYDSTFNNCPGEKREVLFARKFAGGATEVLDAIDALAMQRQRAVKHKQALTEVMSDGPN